MFPGLLAEILRPNSIATQGRPHRPPPRQEAEDPDSDLSIEVKDHMFSDVGYGSPGRQRKEKKVKGKTTPRKSKVISSKRDSARAAEDQVEAQRREGELPAGTLLLLLRSCRLGPGRAVPSTIHISVAPAPVPEPEGHQDLLRVHVETRSPLKRYCTWSWDCGGWRNGTIVCVWGWGV